MESIIISAEQFKFLPVELAEYLRLYPHDVAFLVRSIESEDMD